MSIDPHINDREHAKFRQPTGGTAIAVVNADGTAISAGGGGGTSMTDDTAFTPAASSVTPIGAFADETVPDAVDEGDVGVVRMTLNRALHVNLRDAGGSELAVGGGTQYDEDTAHVSGDKLTLAGAVRRDAAASGTSADGDRATINVDGSGLLWSRIGAALPAGTNNLGDVDVLTQPARARTVDHVGAADMTDALMTGTTALTPKFTQINVTASGDATIVALVSGKKIRVLRYALVAGAAVNVRWFSGASPTTPLTGLMNFAANGGVSEAYCPLGLFENASGVALVLNLSAAVQVGGSLTYVEV